MNRYVVVFLIFVLVVFRPQVKADEGMWLPFMIDDALFDEMQDMGLNLTRNRYLVLPAQV
jgi:hypothetical protein